jgi:acetylornithine deacetylase/succinyl-diaminopimelate desuccinylase-like protein
MLLILPPTGYLAHRDAPRPTAAAYRLGYKATVTQIIGFCRATVLECRAHHNLDTTRRKAFYPLLNNGNRPVSKIKTMFLTTLSLLVAASLQAASPSADDLAFRAVYKELVEINTTLSGGSCTVAAHAMADQLRASGINDADIHIIVAPEWPEQGNLVATLHGSSPDNESILLLAHIDVVEANRADWERDPFTLIEEDGYFFGRGTADDKSMAAIFVDVMKGLSESKFPLSRNVKLALTCGEETPNTFNGASYLIQHHRELIDASFALNEGGGGRLDSAGKPLYNGIQAGEKLYQDYQLEVRNPGGHSSRPRADNAIYQLAAALERVSQHAFPIEFNSTTRGFFARMAKLTAEPQVATDMIEILTTPPNPEALARMTNIPGYNSILHTTCVTTLVTAGHAKNALPQRASANVNCRIFPGNKPEEIRLALEQVVNDAGVVITFVDPPEKTSPPPALTADILGPIETLTEQMWPGVPVIPSMIAGGTDGRFLTPAGIPTYGVSGLFTQPNDVNAHGLNEKVLVKSLYDSREFLERLVKMYAGWPAQDTE